MFLHVRFDLGIGAVMVLSNTMVSDGVWHTVTVTRLGDAVTTPTCIVLDILTGVMVLEI